MPASKQSIDARIMRNRAAVQAYKAAKPCADCGITYPSYVMEFDHLSDKLANIADMQSRTIKLERIIAEMEKCDLVCANCHRIRTWKRREEGIGIN